MKRSLTKMIQFFIYELRFVIEDCGLTIVDYTTILPCKKKS